MNMRDTKFNLPVLCRALALAGLIATGCMTNTETLKSSNGREIAVHTGTDAMSAAERMPGVMGGSAQGKRDPKLEAVAVFDGPDMPVGIAVSQQGRIFMSFPRWQDPVKSTLVELRDGKMVAFPDEQTNAFDATKPEQYKPVDHLISVQAIVFDDRDRLWVLDPGSFNFGPSILSGPKLWCYDIQSGQRIKQISFPTQVAHKMTALNDVRFDLSRGSEGTAYITDSGIGGIIVVDLASGKSWRHLDEDPSVVPAIGLNQTSEGQPLLQRKASGEIRSPNFHSDGIALSPDGKTLYYNAVVSRELYSVPTDLLADPMMDEQKIKQAVKKVATKPSGNDGILCDQQGRVYSTDFEDSAIRRTNPADGSVQTVAQDDRLLWPDTLAMRNGYLYVTTNQLARQPNYHFGKDQRQPPYALFRVRIE